MVINCLYGNLSVNMGDMNVFWHNVCHVVIWLIINVFTQINFRYSNNKLTIATIFACNDRKTKLKSLTHWLTRVTNIRRYHKSVRLAITKTVLCICN